MHSLKQLKTHNKFIEAKCRTQLLFNLAYIIMVYDVFPESHHSNINSNNNTLNKPLHSLSMI